MKDYKQLLKELPSSTIVCAFSEFDPPTVGHELLIKTVKRLAEEKNSAHIIYTQSAKNPVLQEDKKSQYLSLMFPKTHVKSLDESLSVTVASLKKKYKNVIVVAGTDQLGSLKRSLKESVQFVTLTEKDPDANESKMKAFATKALYEQFKEKLPTAIRDIDGKRLMNDIRHGMGLEPIKEQINLVKDELRERYFRGEIFNVGQLVESSGQQYEIVKRGSNHLLLKSHEGELVSKWITDVSELSEGVVQPNGTDQIQPAGPEKDSEKQDGNSMSKPNGVKKGFLTFYGYTKDKTTTDPSRGNNVAATGSGNQISSLRQESVESLDETALNKNDPHGDYQAKRKALQDIQMDPHTHKDPKLKDELAYRTAALEKEYDKYRVKEETVEEKKDRQKQLKRFADQCQPQDRPGISTETKPPLDPFFKEEADEVEIDEMISSVSFDDILDLYEEDEIVLVYEDTGEILPEVEDESKIDLMEVLSRQERLKAKIRFRKSQAKRERSTKIALKRYSPVKTINSRARRLAVRLMKQRLLRGRNYNDISIGEKERIDNMISKRKVTIDRIAAKLVSRIRKTEKGRMSHDKVTQTQSNPNIF